MRILILLLFVVTVIVACKKDNDDGPSTPSFSVTSISPDNGSASTVVTITGTGFSTVASENKVKFNGIEATVQSATATQLIVIVPAGAGTGAVTVQKGSQTITGPSFVYTPSITVTTLAGQSNEGMVDATGSAAKFNYPVGIVCDAQGNLYVGDAANHRIRKVTPTGVVTTFAGSTIGNIDATGTAAQLNSPCGMTIDAQGNFYTGDIGNYKIRKISATAVVTTLAGGNQGSLNGQGGAAQFNAPIGVCSDAQGNIYVADHNNHSIRKITPAGLVSTLAGGTQGNADGTGAAAQFESPYGLCIDAQGNIYVADNVSSRIRKITPAGVVTTVAGTTAGMQNGNAAIAKFDQPNGVCVDAQGNLYVSDYNNNCIRKITQAGVVSTLAGTTQGFQDGSAAQAKFYKPGHICIDATGNLYVADRYNHRIRKISMQ